MKKISVIVPTIGARGYLDKTLSSLLDQSVPFEEIIVFDNSDNQNLQSDSQHADQPRLRWIHSGSKLDALLSWNTAVKACTNQYVIIMGDDDLALANFHEQALELLQRSEFAMLPFDIIDADGVGSGEDSAVFADLDSDQFRYLRFRNKVQFTISGVLFNKKKFLTVGGFEDTGFPRYNYTDDLLWFQLSALENKVAFGDRLSWRCRRIDQNQGAFFSIENLSDSFESFIDLMTERLIHIGVDKNRIFSLDYSRKQYFNRSVSSWFRHVFLANLSKNPFKPSAYLPQIIYYLSGNSSLFSKVAGVFHLMYNLLRFALHCIFKKLK